MAGQSSGVIETSTGAVVNVLLSGLKIWVGLASGSQALVADGVHSLSDLATDIVVIWGIIASRKPYDQEHPYGHKRLETISEMVVGAALFLVAAYLLWSAVKNIKTGQDLNPSIAAISVAVISVVAKEIIYRYTLRVSRSTGNKALLANAWHHRSDAITSLIVLATLLAARINHNFWILDPVAGIALAVLIGKLGITIAYQASEKVADRAPDPETVQKISRAALSHEGVRGVHKLRTRYLGSDIIADLHILVDPAITVEAGHAIAWEVEKKIKGVLADVCDVTVHVEPELKDKDIHP